MTALEMAMTQMITMLMSVTIRMEIVVMSVFLEQKSLSIMMVWTMMVMVPVMQVILMMIMTAL
jgi:hypothetical protein